MSSRDILVVLVLSVLQLTRAHQHLVKIQTCFILDNSTMTSKDTAVEMFVEPTNNVIAKLGLNIVLAELLTEDQLDDNDDLGEKKEFITSASMLEYFRLRSQPPPHQEVLYLPRSR